MTPDMVEVVLKHCVAFLWNVDVDVKKGQVKEVKGQEKRKLLASKVLKYSIC